MVKIPDENFCIFYNSVIAFFDFKNGPASSMHLHRSIHNSEDLHYRISVLGAKGVGKTAIIVRYLTRRYIGEYRSQIDVSYSHMISISNKKAYIDLIDFSPKSEECILPGLNITSSDCFLVVFSIDDRTSFLKAVNIVSILRALPSSCSTPLTLLGNKKDLEHVRQVSLGELENIASLLKCDYAEVSVAESIDDIVPVIFNLLKKTITYPKKLRECCHMNIGACSNSDPCLVKNQDNSLLYNINRVADNTFQGSSNENYVSSNYKPTDNNGNENLCSVCCKVHFDKNVRFANESKESRVQDLPSHFKKFRTSGRNLPVTRTRSLQGRERRTKNENKLTRNKIGAQALIIPNCKPFDETKLSPDIKKEFRFKNFLNCSRGSDESAYFPNNQHISDECYRKNQNTKVNSNMPQGDSSIEDLLLSEISSPVSSNLNVSNKLPQRKHTLAKLVCPEQSTKFSQQESSKFSPNITPQPSPKPPKSSRESKTSIMDFAYSRLSTGNDQSTVLRISKDYVNDKNPLGPWKIPVKRERERKFGVFGKGLLGNMFLKTSLPDLPKATASFYTKIDSIKKTIQKRSI